MRILNILAIALLMHQFSNAQVTFNNSSALLGDGAVFSGVAMGVVDMNGDGLDDIVRLNLARELRIGYQRADGQQFDHYNTLYTNNGQWSLCVADVDKNGYNDVFLGGAYNGLSIVMFDSIGMDTAINFPNTDIFLQGSNFADINNDGYIDIYACHDEGLSHAYRNDGSGAFIYDTSLIATFSNDVTDNSGNYASIWTDYDSDGDLDMYLSKCRSGVTDSTDGRRVNQLWENNGNNKYIDVAEVKAIRPLAQSWSTDFADIDNDGDMDAFVINHIKTSMFYENIDNIAFSDFTPTSGVATELENWGTGIQTKFADFDNDGYIDLIVTGVGGYYLFKNNGDKTFTDLSNAFPATTPNIQSMAIGDLNNDGFLDVLAGFANGYNSPSTKVDRLFTNNGNSNNWVKINLVGTSSNINGIGARLELYGPLGQQIREIRSGEGYGIMNSFTAHFGIDSTMEIDSIVVKWPSGVRDVICTPAINTTVKLIESCQSTCEGLFLNLDDTICAGEHYLFDGIERTETGIYTMQTNSVLGCDSTVVLDLTVIEIDNNIVVNQDLGTITADQIGATYQWLDCSTNPFGEISGANQQTFEAEIDGNYAVEISKDGCETTSNCETIVITSLIEDFLSFDIEIYPNPIENQLNVSITNAPEFIQLQLFDVQGQEKLNQLYKNQSQIELDTKNLLPGIYFLKVNIDGEEGSVKLVKY